MSEAAPKGFYALAALKSLPDSLAQALTQDPAFCEAVGLPQSVRWTLGPMNLELDLGDLLAAIRTWQQEGVANVVAGDGSSWELQELNAKDRPVLVLTYGQKRQPLPPMDVLSPLSGVRLQAFEITASDLLLDPALKADWEQTLEANPLTDSQYSRLENDFDLTPARVLKRLRSSISSAAADQIFAPEDRSYYERLIGPSPGHHDLPVYCEAVSARGRALVATYGPRGLVRALHLCGHPTISSGLAEGLPAASELLVVSEEVARSGGLLSLVALIEALLPRLAENPELQPALEMLVDRFAELDKAAEPSRYRVLSALFVMIEGNFAALGTLDGAPPFWRRHASLVQASLLEEEVARLSLDLHHFVEWAVQAYPGIFHHQTLAEIRIEPRWLPRMASAEQFRAELIGRVVSAAFAFRDSLPPPLRRRLLGRRKNSFVKLMPIPQAFLPGPLEGGFFSAPPPPEEVRQAITTDLSATEITAASFTALVNTALIYGAGAEFAEIAGDALRQAQYRLRGSPNRDETVAVLEGLACVAAVTRTRSLADELRVLVRRYRVTSAACLAPEEAFHIGLMAAASREALSDWAEFAGEWVTELAFQDISREDAEKLRGNLSWLASRVPELALHSGRAIAALEARLI